jgi:simple sugar transport system permease protein
MLERLRRAGRAFLEPGVLRVAIALGGALCAFNLISFAFGQAPLEMLARAFVGTWGTPYGIGQVLFKSTPLLFTGLAFHIALRAGMFNIGTEGQLALASLLAAWAAVRLPPSCPAVVGVALVLTVAMAVGAAVAGIAGLMRARLGVHEIISGIMLNRSADVLLPWVLVAGLGATGLRTSDVAPATVLPRLAQWLPPLSGSAASVAFPAAVLLVLGTYRWLERSRLGREMRWTGLGESVCAAQGIAASSRRVQAMLLSGATAGLVMSSTVLGYKGYYELGLGAGTGFTGIAVAMLGRGSALALVGAALLFGTVAQAGLAINAQVPKEAMGVIEAVVIILAAMASAKQAPIRTGASPKQEPPRAPLAPTQEPPRAPLAPAQEPPRAPLATMQERPC